MSAQALHVAPRPCSTCPYRRDTPPGIWHPDEYERLADFDDVDADGVLPTSTFRCHQQTATGVPTACRGWLTVHADSVAVRVAVVTGQVTIDQVRAPVPVDLYASGAEARDAGLAGVADPSPEALQAIASLVVKGVVTVDLSATVETKNPAPEGPPHV